MTINSAPNPGLDALCATVSKIQIFPPNWEADGHLASAREVSVVMEGSRRPRGSSKPSCALECQGRLLEEGTPELVLKEEQGPVKPEGGSLADEMGSDAGWAAPHEDQQQEPVGGNEALASSQDFAPGSQEGLKNGGNSEVCASLTGSCLLSAQHGVWDVGARRPRATESVPLL